jgi:hypothetical protein
MGEVIDFHKAAAAQKRRRDSEGTSGEKMLHFSGTIRYGAEIPHPSRFCGCCETAKGFDGKCWNAECLVGASNRSARENPEA